MVREISSTCDVYLSPPFLSIVWNAAGCGDVRDVRSRSPPVVKYRDLENSVLYSMLFSEGVGYDTIVTRDGVQPDDFHIVK